MKRPWLLCSLAVGFAMVAHAQKAPEQKIPEEIVTKTPEVKSAWAQMNALLAVLNDPARNIFQDEAAQKELLSPRLMQLVLDARTRQIACEQRHPNEPVTQADNAIFLHAWDKPTEIGLRTLEPGTEEITFNMEFKWGPETNYPGDVRDVNFVFQKVDGKWQLDDILHVGTPQREEVKLSTFLNETWHD